MEVPDALIIFFLKLGSPFAPRSCPVCWGRGPTGPHQPLPLTVWESMVTSFHTGFIFCCCSTRGQLSLSRWRICSIGLLICLKSILLPALTSWLLILAWHLVQLVINSLNHLKKRGRSRDALLPIILAQDSFRSFTSWQWPKGRHQFSLSTISDTATVMEKLAHASRSVSNS